jgi:hypothetical protein
MTAYVELGENWAAAFLSLFLALTAGWGAAQLERRLGWDIAAFWRGAFFGLLIFTGVAVGLDQRTPPGSVGVVARLAFFGACVISCGIIGLRCLRSSKVH